MHATKSDDPATTFYRATPTHFDLRAYESVCGFVCNALSITTLPNSWSLNATLCWRRDWHDSAFTPQAAPRSEIANPQRVNIDGPLVAGPHSGHSEYAGSATNHDYSWAFFFWLTCTCVCLHECMHQSQVGQRQGCKHTKLRTSKMADDVKWS